MNCNDARELLYEYLTARLSDADRAQVDEHLSACEKCRQERNEISRTLSVLDSARPARLSPDFNKKLLARVKQDMGAQHAPGRWPRLRTVVAFAACFVIAVVSLLYVTQPSLDPESHVRGPQAPVLQGDACREAMLLYNQGCLAAELHEQERLYRAALDVPCDNASIRARIFNNLADCRNRQSHYDDAVHLYQSAISLDPDLYYAYLGLGMLFKEKGQLSLAAASLEKAIVLMQGAIENGHNISPEEIAHYKKALQDVQR